MTSYVEKILAVHASLDDAGIPHAYGGALALGYHVESPRATVDIDVLHETVAGRTEEVPLGNDRIPVLSATDLTVFKALFDRPKDWVDIGEMLAFGGVDRGEVSAWLVRLVGSDDPRATRFAALA